MTAAPVLIDHLQDAPPIKMVPEFVDCRMHIGDTGSSMQHAGYVCGESHCGQLLHNSGPCEDIRQLAGCIVGIEPRVRRNGNDDGATFAFPSKVEKVMQYVMEGDYLDRPQRDLSMIVRRPCRTTALRLLHELETCLYIA
jgi:hypothetical protein